MRIVDSFSSWTRHALGDDGFAEIHATLPATGEVRFRRMKGGIYSCTVSVNGKSGYAGGQREPIRAFRAALAKLEVAA